MIWLGKKRVYDGVQSPEDCWFYLRFLLLIIMLILFAVRSLTLPSLMAPSIFFLLQWSPSSCDLIVIRQFKKILRINVKVTRAIKNITSYMYYILLIDTNKMHYQFFVHRSSYHLRDPFESQILWLPSIFLEISRTLSCFKHYILKRF